MHISAGKFACVLFTDLHRSSHIWEYFPEEAAVLHERHTAAVEAAAEQFSGQIVKELGDGYYLIFSSAEDCIRAACSVMEAAEDEADLPDRTPVRYKTVCHAGYVNQLSEHKQDFHGPVVNITSRVGQLCNPGQLLVSADLLRLAPGDTAKWTDLGVHYFRDLAEPLHIFQVWRSGAEPTFPLLASLGQRPTNLRAAVDSFIGRESEHEFVCSLLRSPEGRLVSIVAPGGYGKTRLADHVSRELLTEFENGVYEIALADVPAAESVGHTLTEVLALPVPAGGDPIQAAISFLKHKSVLLYFDNFEHVLDAALLLSRLLQGAPALKCIVTSREPLRVKGERIFRLEPLALNTGEASAISPAALLFLQRSQLNPEQQDLAVIEELCQQLGGIPLALELAAAWTDVYEPRQLLASFNNSLEITGRARDLHLRHSSVRDCLDWSFRLLDPTLRRAVLQLGVFRNGFTAQMASTVLDESAEPLLGILLDKCWLARARGTQRFSLRDVPTQEYVAAAFEQSDLSEASCRKHLEIFRELLADAGPRLGTDEEPEVINSLRREAENITAALRFAAASSSEATGELLRVWSRALVATGQVQQLAEMLDQLAPLLRGSAQLFQLELARGVCSIHLQNTKQADQHLTAALQLARSQGDPADLALTLSHLGHCRYWQLDFVAAEQMLQESLQLYSGLGMRRESAAPQHNLAITYFGMGRIVEAETLLHDCLQIPHQSKSWVAIHLQALRYCATAKQEYHAAKEYGRRSLDLYREVGNRRAEAQELLSLAELACYEGRASEMHSLARQAHVIVDGLGDPTLAVQCQVSLAQAALLTELPAEANASLDRAVSLLDSNVSGLQRFAVFSLKQITEPDSALKYFLRSWDEVRDGLPEEYALQALFMFACALCQKRNSALGGPLLEFCKQDSHGKMFVVEANHLESDLVRRAEGMLDGSIDSTRTFKASLTTVCAALEKLAKRDLDPSLSNFLAHLNVEENLHL